MDLQGKLLIAIPQLEDYFHHTIVYVCEHSAQGSMGIVLNQPTDLSIAELYSKLHFMSLNNRTFSDRLVLAGGPTNTDRGFILHHPTTQDFEHSYKINDEITLTTSADIVATFGSPAAPSKYLVALGCAGWESGQLEREIAENAWLVTEANDQILFDLPYENRYAAASQLLSIDPLNFAADQAGHA